VRAASGSDRSTYVPLRQPPPETLEQFLFAEGAGWYAWDSARGSATFDRLGGPALMRTARCGEPAR
jgi:hypothetical protein